MFPPSPSSSHAAITIREMQLGDEADMRSLFYNTVCQVNCRDYSPEQIEVWSSSANQDDFWATRLPKSQVLVAVQNTKIVGFTNLETDGHVDLFYVHHLHQGQGVGSRLMAALDALARDWNLNRLYSEVSITAKPFFLKSGFQVVQEEQVERQGVWFTRFVMEKQLSH
ncbi:MAG TPA: GNAT family N-acetyltransferase [Trichocoleus sp.]